LTTKSTWSSTLSLPILTLDERILSPRLGYVFDRGCVNPYESIVGMLWKFARVNALPGYTVVSQICHGPVDPYLGIAPADVNIRAAASLLGLTQRRVREGLGTMRTDVSGSLRYCSKCTASGYHSTLHQLARFERCPLHREPLELECRSCRCTSSYRLDAQLLDAPFRCRHCRHPYACCGNVAMRFRSLASHERVTVTRSWMT